MASVPDFRTGSPVPSSGRASPANPRLRQRDEEALAKKDKAYKRWAATIERVLATFDQSVDEWADYISFLGRLLKAIQTRPPNVDDIPFKIVVAKRLSQCLSPALPSGVHQKALDLYSHIFSFLGQDGLSRDISLYLPGLAPLVSFASLSVKPLVLGVFEEHITKLDATAIRPALKALILSLLPALEEENSDEFERALQILETLKARSGQSERRTSAQAESVLPQFFWQCLFLAGITSASRRSGVLAYLVRTLPTLNVSNKIASTSNGSGTGTNGDVMAEKIAAVAQPDPGLLIRCLCAGLLDENVLVQRGFLDLLVDRVPLSSFVLQEKAAREDLKKLIIAATNVVLRRDMSLNRRLWAWFLGPSAANDADDAKVPVSPDPAALKTPTTAESHFSQMAYFVHNALPVLVEALKAQLEAPNVNAGDRTKALRICLALMDRFEIGNPLISHIFVPALSSIQDFQNSKAPKSAKNEVLRSGSAFFDSVESFVIWHEVIELVNTAFEASEPELAAQKLNLVAFVLSRFNVREEEMQSIHLPLAALFLLQKLSILLRAETLRLAANVETINIAFRVANALLQQIPARSLGGGDTSGAAAAVDQSGTSGLAVRIKSFYSNTNASEKRLLSENDIGSGLVELVCDLATQSLAQYATISRPAIEGSLSLLDVVFRRATWYPVGEKIQPLLEQLSRLSRAAHLTDERHQDIALTLTITSILEVIHANEHAQSRFTPSLQRAIVPQLVHNVWQALSPGRPQHHVEASRCLWRLHAVTLADSIVEGTIVGFGSLVPSQGAPKSELLDHAHRFTIFWQQSQGQSEMAKNRRGQVVRVQNTLTAGKLQLLGRPLFQMLDTLLDADDGAGLFIEHWLEDLPDLAIVVNVVLAHTDKATRLLTGSETLNHVQSPAASDEVDLDACIYFVRLLEKVVLAAKPSLEKTLQQSAPEESREQLLVRFQFIIDTCIKIQTTRHPSLAASPKLNLDLRRATLGLLEQVSRFLSPESLTRLNLDIMLLDELQQSVEQDNEMLQIALTRAASSALSRRFEAEQLLRDLVLQNEEAEIAKGVRRSSLAKEKLAAEQQYAVPSKVLSCILAAFSSRGGLPVLDCWFDFLRTVLHLYGPNIFQVILPLNECFCRVLRAMAQDLKATFMPDTQVSLHVNENAIIQVLNALERPLEIAHVTLQDLVAQDNGPKNEQQAASFFGMVSVLAPEGGKVKSSAENNRLTVLLCFKDALRVCFEIWSIDESSAPGVMEDSTRLASFKYTILRLRNRTRRIVEHLFQARDLECVETLVALWHDCMMEDDATGCSKVLALLSTVETARPKVIIPALFNAIYSRTHPAALDPDKRSSLTSSISEVTLTAFSISYLRSLEDDATDEIWQSCLTFLKDVLTSPLNHRQILVQLLEFAVELGAKINNTNFGEQRKMRRELGDLFIRLLTAIATIRPPGMNTEQKKEVVEEGYRQHRNAWYKELMSTGSADLVSVLALIFPRLTDTLLERDRIAVVATTVSNQILAPTLKSKVFPDNVDREVLELLKVVGQVTEAAKSYKKDVSDAFNDAKFFSNNLALVSDGWLPVIRQWAIGDKERLPELFSRLTPPAAAGLMFGVGASSARLEADRRTQLTLRRICILFLAAPQDAFVVNLPELSGKIVELLNANVASSPSSVTRAELYMLFRTLLLRISANHLNPLWPILNAEIADGLSSAMPGSSDESLNVDSLLQLCKLVDTLLLLNMDEFQLQEWLFITDTPDAVYRPADVNSLGLTDLLAESLDSDPNGLSAAHLTSSTTDDGLRKPLLSNGYIRNVVKSEYRDKIFRPFFRQLSIASFEGSYSMQLPDVQLCVDNLIADIFDASTIV